MDRYELAALLDREGIDSESCRLDGAHKEDAVVLEHRGGQWDVVFWERGQRSDLGCFADESRACELMAETLLVDPDNRFQLVVGPKPRPTCRPPACPAVVVPHSAGWTRRCPRPAP